MYNESIKYFYKTGLNLIELPSLYSAQPFLYLIVDL